MDNREKWIRSEVGVTLTNPTYPKCRVQGKSPYDEQIMSMPTMIDSTAEHKVVKVISKRPGIYFFFIYNLDNYYHFLYDTLPYLYFYFTFLDQRPTLLLPQGHKLLPFQEQTFRVLGLNPDTFEYAEEGVEYGTLYIASSLTHGQTADGRKTSNLPPSYEATAIWRRLVQAAHGSLRGKYYISRRSWVHGLTDNIGTNYTTRRRCLNEDAVVALCERYGYKEIFCELMSMEEKIALFASASHIAGFIGGGLANLLFSGPGVKVACIETPEFLRINERFSYLMDHTDITYLQATRLANHEGPWPLFCRVCVKATGLIGEIEGWHSGSYIVKVSNNDVAGFALNADFAKQTFRPDELEPLDGGLNSPFICDLNLLEQYLVENGSTT